MGVNSYCLEYAVFLAPDCGESLSSGVLILSFNFICFIELRLIEVGISGSPKKDVMGVAMIQNYVNLVVALLCVLAVSKDTMAIKRKDSVITASEKESDYVSINL